MTETKTIKDYIARELVTFAPEMQIVDAVAQMLEQEISGAPVVDATGNLVGIITAKDCFRAALHASYYQGWSGIVSDFMTHDVETLDASLDLVSAAQRFLDTKFRRFPVIRDGRLIGLIMRLDLLRALNSQWSG